MEQRDASRDRANDNDRVLRGGSWNNKAQNVRSAQRIGNVPDSKYFDWGFRLARI